MTFTLMVIAERIKVIKRWMTEVARDGFEITVILFLALLEKVVQIAYPDFKIHIEGMD